MQPQALSANELRVIIAVLGVVILALIYYFGRGHKPEQGRRQSRRRQEERVEPVLGEGEGGSYAETAAESPEQGELDVDLRTELERLGNTLAGDEGTPGGFLDERDSGRASPGEPTPTRAAGARAPLPGKRPDRPVQRLVTLFVSARAGETFKGPDLVVAAEKAGLDFGDMGIFHRMHEGAADVGPIFSVANMVKPGKFDMTRIEELETPGLSFFMTLPGPLPALDAWDAMLPTAQRLAELLNGLVLDEERNALGRQRIAHIRDELRVWDRRHEGEEMRFDPR